MAMGGRCRTALLAWMPQSLGKRSVRSCIFRKGHPSENALVSANGDSPATTRRRQKRQSEARPPKPVVWWARRARARLCPPYAEFQLIEIRHRLSAMRRQRVPRTVDPALKAQERAGVGHPAREMSLYACVGTGGLERDDFSSSRHHALAACRTR